MAGRKKSAKSTKSARGAAASAPAASSGDKLLGAIFHNGKTYSGKRPSDVAAFKKAIAGEKGLSAEQLQRLADKGVIAGFGTKAAKASGGKPGRQRAEIEAEGEGEVGVAPDEVAGGGVDAEEEPTEGDEEEA